jgi:hypothetical protein
MRREEGQATVEWVALVLLAACVLCGVGLGMRASARGAGPGGAGLGGEGLGEAVAARIVCGARGGTRCPAPRRSPSPRSPAPRSPSPRSPARSSPLRAEGVQRLRGVAQVAKRVWVVCLGYKRLRYEVEHPRTSGEPMPLDEALGIANDCFNPLGFLGAG